MFIADLERTDELADGGLVGVAVAPRSELDSAFGSPHVVNSFDGKVSLAWNFETPRGIASVYDMAWRREGTWSIGAADWRAGLWLRHYLRQRGFVARSVRADLAAAA